METPSASPSDDAARDQEAWACLKDLVADALEADAAVRADLVARRCQGHPDLQARAQALLGEAAGAGDFLEQPALQAPLAAPLPPGSTCAGFRIERLVGEGGFGEVYEAHQDSPFARRVALKLLKSGLASASLLARFALERSTLARLEHPGIARILDAGATPDGRQFFAMEFVAGRTLTQFVAAEHPPLRTRLDLLLQACAAVTHAHQRGVIHRDLKPSNLLVTNVDGGPVVKVIDFGIARVLEGADPSLANLDQGYGTPGYSSPEQRSGPGNDVDTRTDVYSLGIVLRELAGDDLRRSRELGWIVARATAAERDRRYGGVAELATDVRAFLAGEALQAGPTTSGYRLRVFARRHRLLLLAGSLVALAVLGGGLAATWGLIDAERSRAEAESARREATATSDYLAELLAAVDPKKVGRDVRVTDLLDASDGILQRAAGEPDVAARLHRVVGNAYRSLGEFTKAGSHLRAATEGYASRHGPFDWRGIAAGFDLASTLAAAGRPDEAASLVRQLEERAASARGPDHPLARLMTDMRAKLAFDRGRPSEAEEPLRKLLAQEERAGDSDRLVQVLGNLSQVLLAMSRAGEALPLAARGRALAMQLHGEDAVETYAATRKLAAVQTALRNDREVVELLEPIVPAARQRLGADHPDVLGIENYLALALQNLGATAAAEEIYRHLVPAQAQKLARLHPQALMTLFQLARLLLVTNRLAEAETLLRDVRERFRALRGEKDRDTLRARLALAYCIGMQGRDEEIADEYAAAVAAARETFGDDEFTRTAVTDWQAHLARRAARTRAASEK